MRCESAEMNPDTFMLPISFVIGVSVHHGYSGKAGAITIARLRSVRQGRQCLELEVDRKSDCTLASPISAYCHPARVSNANANEEGGSRTASIDKIPRPLSSVEAPTPRRSRACLHPPPTP